VLVNSEQNDFIFPLPTPFINIHQLSM
jgi:hypothetical protein